MTISRSPPVSSGGVPIAARTGAPGVLADFGEPETADDGGLHGAAMAVAGVRGRGVGGGIGAGPDVQRRLRTLRDLSGTAEEERMAPASIAVIRPG